MAFDITTQGKTGFTGSDTSAWSGKLSSGMRRPAIAITTLVWPAATTPTRLRADRCRAWSRRASTAPRASRRMPVTSQFWMMSTPSASAARA